MLIKCVIVGDKGVGKTSLVMAYVKQSSITQRGLVYDNNYLVDIESGIRGHKLDIWDTPEDYKIRRERYRGADVVIICYSVTCPRSFVSAKQTWLPEVGLHCPGVPAVLVATKAELRHNDDTLRELHGREMSSVPQTYGVEMAKENGVSHFVECSAHNKQSIDKVFEEAARAALCGPEQETVASKCCLIL